VIYVDRDDDKTVCIRLIQGKECRHDAHQDAQRPTYTTCSLNAAMSSRSSALAPGTAGDASMGSRAITVPSAGRRRLGTRCLGRRGWTASGELCRRLGTRRRCRARGVVAFDFQRAGTGPRTGDQRQTCGTALAASERTNHLVVIVTARDLRHR
jgi:hypothetical protein